MSTFDIVLLILLIAAYIYSFLIYGIKAGKNFVAYLENKFHISLQTPQKRWLRYTLIIVSAFFLGVIELMRLFFLAIVKIWTFAVNFWKN